MKNCFCLIILYTTLITIGAYPFLEEKHPLVHLNDGLIKGTLSITQNNRKYYAFRGIPYAKPPIGDLRFKPPESVSNWTGTLDATKNPPPCIQKNYLFGKEIEGDEDCLYLNVYVPQANTTSRRRCPRTPKMEFSVMVFIHWGGFFTGYSGSDYIGPEYLIDNGVIIVTFNYRLGIFGFLSTNDDASPGNYGLKDQTFALTWVRNNIDKFGGNPNNVTIFGQSAGGASVHYHMLSPLSRGLFRAGISQSGTALSLWAKPVGPIALEIATAQAELVGCHESINDTDSLVTCLRQIDARDLVKSGDRFKFFSIDPLTVYLPSIETKTERNPRPFITKQPIDYLISGDFFSVPWILGSVGDEGIIRAAPLLSHLETREKLARGFNDLMPKLMALVMSTTNDQIHNVWKRIKNYYFGGKDVIDIDDSHSIQGLINLYTDRSFAYSLYQTVLIHSIKGRHNLWLYNFNYRGRYSYRKHFVTIKSEINYNWGVSHCDELIYLFRSPALFPDLESENDRSMRRYMTSLWTNFALYGDPTRIPLDGRDWPTIKPSIKVIKSFNFLNISGNHKGLLEFSFPNGLFNDRLRFWERLPLAENIEDLGQKHIEL